MKSILGFIVIGFFALLPFIPPFKNNDLLWFIAASFYFIPAYYTARWTGFSGFRELGFTLHHGARKNFVIGLMFGVFLMLLYLVVVFIIDHHFIFGVKPILAWLPSIFSVAMSTCFIAISEEILVRGYAYQHLSRYFSPLPVIILTALIFTAFHFPHIGAPFPYWLYLFTKGITFALPVYFTHSIWMSLGIHWGGDFIWFLFLGDRSVLEIKWTDPPWANWVFLSVGILSIVLTFWIVRFSEKSPSSATIGSSA